MRVCKAISIHKSQGITVGPGKLWEKVVIALPGPNDRTTPGMEYVALGRATVKEAFAIYCDEEVTMDRLLKIGKGAASDKRRAFEQRLRDLADDSQQPLRRRIIARDTHSPQTFNGGFNEILREFREDHPHPEV
jgi:hypothetical protein